MNSSGNQTTTATRGGASATATPANSGGSGLFGGSTVGSTHGSAAKVAQSGPVDGGKRRASQEQTGLFGNLSSLKRDTTDASKNARKSSLGEQKAQPGMLGQMFNNITKNGDSK